MKVWIVTVNCDEMSPSFTIDGVYGSEQKAKEAKESLLCENPDMDLDIEILETKVL
jgi:hypothetical protein